LAINLRTAKALGRESPPTRRTRLHRALDDGADELKREGGLE